MLCVMCSFSKEHLCLLPRSGSHMTATRQGLDCGESQSINSLSHDCNNPLKSDGQLFFTKEKATKMSSCSTTGFWVQEFSYQIGNSDCIPFMSAPLDRGCTSHFVLEWCFWSFQVVWVAVRSSMCFAEKLVIRGLWLFSSRYSAILGMSSNPS